MWLYRKNNPTDDAFVYACLAQLSSEEGRPLKISVHDLGNELNRSQPTVHCIICMHNDDAIGMALWQKRFSPYSGGYNFFLIDIVVTEQWRGQGVGKGFFRHFEEVCREERLRKIEFFVDSDNHKAQAFYRSLGYVHQSYVQHWGKPVLASH